MECRASWPHSCACDKKRAEEKQITDAERAKHENELLQAQLAEIERLERLEKFNAIKEKINRRKSLQQAEHDEFIKTQAIAQISSQLVATMTDDKSVREKQLEQELAARDDMLRKIQADYKRRLEEMSAQTNAIMNMKAPMPPPPDSSDSESEASEEIKNRIDHNNQIIANIEESRKSALKSARLEALSQGRSPNLSTERVIKKKMNSNSPPKPRKLNDSLTKKAVKRLNGVSSQDLPKLDS